MTIRNPADSIELKNTILRGVYDDNLRINSDLPDPVKVKSRRRQSRSGILVFTLVFLCGALALGSFVSLWNTETTVEPVVVETVENLDALPITTVEVKVPVPVAVQSYPLPLSFIIKPPDAVATDFSTDKLLDYSFVLNNDRARLSSIFGLDVQTIVIDPGHGGRDPGAIGAMGTREKDIVLDIARRLRDRLMQSGKYNVVLTRERDQTLSLAERVELVNLGRTDLFISLHVNALPQQRVNLIETYYYGPPSDEETLRLAEQENRGSGLLTKDFENMIKKIGNTFKEQESASLAAAIQHSLFTNVKKYDKNTADAGTKIAPFVVLLGVDSPSVLVEISCISKKQEELKLNLPAYREEITSFLAEGITRYLARRNLHVVKGEENDKKARSKSS